jgi:hypothetical protein
MATTWLRGTHRADGSGMTSSIRALALLAAVATAPLSASSPGCLLVHPTVPADGYLGQAALAGQPGGVLDDCSNFTATPWDLSNPSPYESLWYHEDRDGFGFWIGAPASFQLSFYLDGQLQHDTGLISFDPAIANWWQWQGVYDRVDFTGVHVLTFYTQLDAIDDWDEDQLAQPLLGQLDGLEETFAASTVPEPATLTLMASGLLGLAGASRRRKFDRGS